MIHGAVLLLYLTAFLLWIRFLLAGSRGRPLGAMAVAAAGVALHGVALVLFARTHGELPLVGPGAAFSTMAFVGGLVLVATLPLQDLARVGIVVLPVILVLQGVAMVAGVQPVPGGTDFEGAGFILHVTFAFVGYQGLILAFAAGLLYLIQFHELKTKRLGRLFHFVPPLATLDLLGRLGVWLGLGALTVSLALGWAWTMEYRGSLEMGDPKVIWAVLSWFVFVGVLVSRRGGERPEHRGAVAAVAGFAVVASMYLVLRLTVGTGGLFL